MVRILRNNLYNVSLSEEELIRLKKLSIKIKKRVLKLIFNAQSGHPGGSLSATDIILVLYDKILNYNRDKPYIFKSLKEDKERDIFILSKGHAAPTLYSVLYEYNFFNEDILKTFREFGSPLQGHPKKGSIPGIEISTGSLGIGASASVGFALAAKLDNLNRRVYTLLGDGECEEGLVWEAAMSAAHFNLDNLIFIIDRNSIQLDDTTENIMSIEPFSAKWDAFGWNIIEIDGNSISELIRAIKTAQELKGKPTAIIAYKIKGEGISFMEFIKEFHGKPPNKEEYENAIKELEKELENLKKNNMILA